jgi:outer membrane receptor for Fe3+-dicitrate
MATFSTSIICSLYPSNHRGHIYLYLEHACRCTLRERSYYQTKWSWIENPFNHRWIFRCNLAFSSFSHRFCINKYFSSKKNTDNRNGISLDVCKCQINLKKTIDQIVVCFICNLSLS